MYVFPFTVTYVDPNDGEARTEFLATECLNSPSGVYLEVITGENLDVLKECDSEVRNLK